MKFKFIMEDINRSPAKWGLFFVQSLVIMFLISLSFLQIKDFFVLENIEKKVQREYPLYFTLDITTDKQLRDIGKGEDSVESAKVIIENLVQNKKIELFILLKDILWDEFHLAKDNLYEENSRQYQHFYLNENSSRVFNLPLKEGRYFGKEDYHYQRKEKIPVVLGEEFRKFYQIEDEFLDRYKIIGFLDKEAVLLDPKAYKKPIYLNKTVLLPFNDKDMGELSYIDNFFGSTWMKTSHPEELLQLQKTLNEKELYTLNFRMISDQMEVVFKDSAKDIQFLLFLSVSVLVFSLISMICSIVTFIQEKKRELAIHLMAGANNSDIILRMLLPIGLIFILTMIVPIFVLKESMLLYPLGIINVVILAVVLVLPLQKINKDNIILSIRRG